MLNDCSLSPEERGEGRGSGLQNILKKLQKGAQKKNAEGKNWFFSFPYLSNRDGEIGMFLFTCEALKENMQILVSPTYTVTIVLCLHKHCKTVNY